jgi:capsid assembly protease
MGAEPARFLLLGRPLDTESNVGLSARSLLAGHILGEGDPALEGTGYGPQDRRNQAARHHAQLAEDAAIERQRLADDERRRRRFAMYYPSVLAAFYGQPLAILPRKLEEIRAVLRARAAGEKATDAEVRAATASRRHDGVQLPGAGVAMMPVFGVIAHRIGSMERASGGVSTEELGATLDGLVSDKSVKSILMVFDSPGGSVAGGPELADKIRSFAGRKKIVASVDSMAASAAYWLASQCSEVSVTPSGSVGSIGVLASHEDHSEADAKAGVKTTYVTSGGSPYKVEGAPEYPLSEDAKADMQSKVDAYYSDFVGAVAKGRRTTVGKVNSLFGKGRKMTAKDAVARGMADRVATLEAVLSVMMGGTGTATATARAAVARMSARGPAPSMAAVRLALEIAAMEDEE